MIQVKRTVVVASSSCHNRVNDIRPVMQRLFVTRPIGLADGLLIVAVGVVVMIVLDGEKQMMRRLGWSTA